MRERILQLARCVSGKDSLQLFLMIPSQIKHICVRKLKKNLKQVIYNDSPFMIDWPRFYIVYWHKNVDTENVWEKVE
jgi:hypothetical protein